MSSGRVSIIGFREMGGAPPQFEAKFTKNGLSYTEWVTAREINERQLKEMPESTLSFELGDKVKNDRVVDAFWTFSRASPKRYAN